jgi:hypothetical protein
MDPYVYYGAVVSILVLGGSGAFLVSGSLIGFCSRPRGSFSKKETRFAFFGQFLQGVVTLAVGILLFNFLRSEVMSAWSVMIACLAYWGIEHIFDRRFVKHWTS